METPGIFAAFILVVPRFGSSFHEALRYDVHQKIILNVIASGVVIAVTLGLM